MSYFIVVLTTKKLAAETCNIQIQSLSVKMTTHDVTKLPNDTAIDKTVATNF